MAYEQAKVVELTTGALIDAYTSKSRACGTQIRKVIRILSFVSGSIWVVYQTNLAKLWRIRTFGQQKFTPTDRHVVALVCRYVVQQIEVMEFELNRIL